jgi:fatty acid amide hydrolase
MTATPNPPTDGLASATDAQSDAIIWQGAAALARRIRSGELTARAVVDAHIQRIEAVNPRLNAVIVPLFAQARQAADRADAAQRAGAPLGPLHGVPVTIKDQFLVQGTPTTMGYVRAAGHRAAADGPLVARLRAAGAIILGKTNVPQSLMSADSSANPLYGRSNNPWDVGRGPGGSSGGEAAIIAAGGSALGLGSDWGGSLRVPAHSCGIHALRPTSGRLTGLDTRGELLAQAGLETIQAQAGPLARSVEDLALAMGVLAAPGQERFDPGVPPVLWRDPSEVDLRRLRVAVYTDDGHLPAAPALRRAVREAADIFSALGAQVVEWQPPDVSHAAQLFFGVATACGIAAWRRSLQGEKPIPDLAAMLQAMAMPPLARRGLVAMLRSRGQARTARIVCSIGDGSALSYFELTQAVHAYRMRFLAALDEGGFDAIICPPLATPAVPHDLSGKLGDYASYAQLYNVLGMPAGVVAATRVRGDEESDRPLSKDTVEQAVREVERGSAGLPVGVQVVARHWREDVALALMAALEGAFRARPGYPARPPERVP